MLRPERGVFPGLARGLLGPGVGRKLALAAVEEEEVAAELRFRGRDLMMGAWTTDPSGSFLGGDSGADRIGLKWLSSTSIK